MEYLEIPMGAELPLQEGVEDIVPFADSVPMADRLGVIRWWRRIVEAADDEDEFSTALEALHTFRLSGFIMPPYSAVFEMYEDGGRN